MKISSTTEIAATLMLGTMVLIALSIAWAESQVRAEVTLRCHNVEIAGALNSLRMVNHHGLMA
jgi:hypothetical protein